MCWLGICDARLWEGGKSLDRSGVMVGGWGGGWGGECWAGGRAGEGCEELCLGLGVFETFKRYVRGRVQALLERSELRGGPGSPPPSSQGCWREAWTAASWENVWNERTRVYPRRPGLTLMGAGQREEPGKGEPGKMAWENVGRERFEQQSIIPASDAASVSDSCHFPSPWNLTPVTSRPAPRKSPIPSPMGIFPQCRRLKHPRRLPGELRVVAWPWQINLLNSFQFNQHLCKVEHITNDLLDD